MRLSLETRVKCAPASSLRYRPPCLASASAYTTLGSEGATARPTWPKPSLSMPFWVISLQVSPPSTDLYTPEPGPLEGGYTFQGGRRVCHSEAYTVLPSAPKARSMAPVEASL